MIAFNQHFSSQQLGSSNHRAMDCGRRWRWHRALIVAGALGFAGNPQAAGQSKGAGESVVVDHGLEDLESEVAALKELESEQFRELAAMEQQLSRPLRRFYDVLDELFAQFAFDAKQGMLAGLNPVAVRQVMVGPALPRDYEGYLAARVAAAIRQGPQVKLIDCLACRSRESRLIAGKMVFNNPASDIQLLRAAAASNGIEFFIDATLDYQPNQVFLVLQGYRAATQEVVWTKTYNSATLQSRFQNLAIDYSQVAPHKPGAPIKTENRILAGMGMAVLPNVSNDVSDANMLVWHFRGTEKFTNRAHEFGMIMNLYQSTNSFLTNQNTTTDGNANPDTGTAVVTNNKEPFTSAMGLQLLYGRHFAGAIESYNEIRLGVNAGGGLVLAPSYVAASVRLGWDVYFGRAWAVVMAINYYTGAKTFEQNQLVAAAGGSGGELAMCYNF